MFIGLVCPYDKVSKVFNGFVSNNSYSAKFYRSNKSCFTFVTLFLH